MGFIGIQEDVEKWVSQYKIGYFPIDKIFYQMSEELGEVAKVLSYIDGIKKPKEGEKVETLGEELVDLVFAIMCMANSNGIDLDKERKKMMEEKKYKRDNNRFEKK